MSKANYKVFEDNGGGLHLYVFGANQEILYAHTGYEYIKGDLSNCLVELDLDADAWKDWDNNLVETNEYNYILALEQLEEGITCGISELIADQDGIYPSRMGNAACLEFDIEY